MTNLYTITYWLSAGGSVIPHSSIIFLKTYFSALHFSGYFINLQITKMIA